MAHTGTETTALALSAPCSDQISQSHRTKYFPPPAPLSPPISYFAAKNREKRDACALISISSRKKILSPLIFEGSLVWTVLPLDPMPSPLHSFAQILAVPARKRVSDLNLWVVISRSLSYSCADKAFGIILVSDNLRHP